MLRFLRFLVGDSATNPSNFKKLQQPNKNMALTLTLHFFLYSVIFSISLAVTAATPNRLQTDLPTVDLGYQVHRASTFKVCGPFGLPKPTCLLLFLTALQL